MSSRPKKIALVTGASRGIGRAIAKRLGEAGALVIVNYASSADAAQALVDEIEAGGGEAFAVQARLGTAAETDGLISAVGTELSRRHGEARLDILVNNAGAGHFGTLSDVDEETFDALFRENTKAPWLMTRAALPLLADGGRVINISSGASRRPGRIFGLYAMTKAAVDAMTLAFAAELGPRGITVNAVAPGWTVTEANAAARRDAETVRAVVDRTALGRLGTPEEIAAVVAFLASDDGGWVTGQYIEASGGFTLV